VFVAAYKNRNLSLTDYKESGEIANGNAAAMEIFSRTRGFKLSFCTESYLILLFLL
jgi:DNA-directed RNA polymerase sigma subunit (sigma70/sigma32)